MTVEAQARVRCCGRLHTISVVDGAVSLDDHRHDSATDAFVALGGDKPRCYEVLDAWRAERKSGLPSALRGNVDGIRRKRSDRSRAAAISHPGALRSSLRRKADKRYGEQIAASLSELVFSLTGESVPVKANLTTGAATRIISAAAGCPLTIQFTASWLNRLWLPGFAVQGSTVIEGVSRPEAGLPSRFRAVTFSAEESRATARLPARVRLRMAWSTGWAFPAPNGSWRLVADSEASRAWAEQQPRLPPHG